MSTTTDPQPPTPPPPHLSERSKQLWRELTPRRASSPERLALLQTALECLDRADEARAVLAQEGLTKTTKTTGAVHLHPLTRVEKESRQQFMSAWQALGLQYRGSSSYEGSPHRDS